MWQAKEFPNTVRYYSAPGENPYQKPSTNDPDFLRKQIEYRAAECGMLKSQIESAECSLQQLNEAYQTVCSENDELQNECRRLRQKLAALKELLEAQYELIA